MIVMIEVTRQCNLECKHCLRGNQQKISVNMWDVDTLFSQIKYIEVLVLTGGEPALHPHRIRAITSIARNKGVTINNFYISTNGTISTNDFLSSIFDLWMYCNVNDESCMEISNDVFHDMKKIQQNMDRLSVFSFTRFRYRPNEFEFSDRFPEYIYDYEGKKDIISEGKGKKYNDLQIPVPDFKKTIERGESFDIYLNSKGNIVLGCDWSYETQDKYYLCHVSELRSYLERPKK